MVNLSIALVLAAGVGTLYSVTLGVAVLILCLATIYLRGYLVPGTPTITKRYVPTGLSEHRSMNIAVGSVGNETADITDVEHILSTSNIIVECEDDWCLADWYQQSWSDRIEEIRERENQHDEVSRFFGASTEEVTIKEYGKAVEVWVDGQLRGQWDSQAGLIADLAAEQLLSDRYDDWNTFSEKTQGKILSGLRAFLDSCPSCGGEITTEKIQSCCSSYESTVKKCQNCEKNVLKTEARKV